MLLSRDQGPADVRPKLTRIQSLKLAAEAVMDERTIRRAYEGRGRPLRGLLLARLTDACAKLGIPTP